MKKYAVGIDLGGTKLAIALVDSNGKVLDQCHRSILQEKKYPKNAPKKIVALMGLGIADFKNKYPDYFNKKNFEGVGLASTGPLNVHTGELLKPSNFPGWGTVKIQKMLEAEMKKNKISGNVFFQNDAMAAALAEGRFGAAKKSNSFAVITLGTGIGSGVIYNGKPAQYLGMGAEWGNNLCTVNKIKNELDLYENSFEGYASGTGILTRAKKIGFQGQSIEELVSVMEKGATEYQILFDEAAVALAALCHNLSIGFRLEKILFSGGLIKARRLYFAKMKKHYHFLLKYYSPEFKSKIQLAKCGNEACVIGAAALVFNESSFKK